MSVALSPVDIERHQRLGIPADLLDLAHVRRVTDQDARTLLSSTHSGDLAGIVYPYHDPNSGQSISCRVRRDHPEIENGTPTAKYLSAYGDRRHLYFAPGAAAGLADTTMPVVIVEAEKSTLAITAAATRASRPILAIGTGGCWSWRGRIGKATSADGARVDEKGPLPDFDRVMWTGRDTIIVFDANAKTNTKVRAARRALATELTGRGAQVRIAELPIEDGINGPDDFIGKHEDAAFLALVDAAMPVQPETADAPPSKSQATRLVDLALAAGAKLWHSPSGDAFVTLPIDSHREHHRLNAAAVLNWLARRYHAETRGAPGRQAIADALGVLGGMAKFDGPEHATAVRVAGGPDAVYLDLGDPVWRAVQITPAGWQVVSDPPVWFVRSRGMLAIPEPTRGGSIEALRSLIHVGSDGDYRLLIGWLLGALCPTGPYPILSLVGEQGSGKSTVARILRRLIDPHAAELRAEPRMIDDVMIAASRSRVVALDNLSHLAPWLSDALCCVATGGALTKRELYSNDDECIIEAIRPTIVTSIADIVLRGDLLDRAIVITLPMLPETDRLPESELWQHFDDARPGILGALLDGAASALARASTTVIAALPRMADWSLWVSSAEPAFGWPGQSVLSAYRAMRDSVNEKQLDGNPLAVAICSLERPWQGTSTELLTLITPVNSPPVWPARYTPVKRPSKGWPANPHALSTALRRLAPSLRRVGIDIDASTREAGTGRRLILITTLLEAGISPSQASHRHNGQVSLGISVTGADPSASQSASHSSQDKAGVTGVTGPVTGTDPPQSQEKPVFIGLSDDRDDVTLVTHENRAFTLDEEAGEPWPVL